MSRLIVFDVDSTLLSVETLDHALALAVGADGYADLARRADAITSAGMEGALDLTQSLARRIALVPMTRETVAAAAADIATRATPGMGAIVADLLARGDQVRAVSGGFRMLIAPALARFGLDETQIYANTFRFDGDVVSGFDIDNPLAGNGGKAVVVRVLRASLGPRETIIVGDGVTDLEAWEMGAADRFIGFGGVARRANVEARAPAYTRDSAELRALLFADA